MGMRLHFVRSIVTLVGLFVAFAAMSQESKVEESVALLKSMGIENIRMKSEGDDTYVSFQDVVYRGTWRGVEQVVDAVRSIDSIRTLHLLFEENGVPKMTITAPKSGEGEVSVSGNTSQAMKVLKGTKVENSRLWKVDFVLYPELYLANLWFDKLYGVAINISPAVELSLWRGATATGQVIIPLYTNLQDEKQYIRPGVIAFHQELKLYERLYTTLAFGNFTDDRWGMDAKINYRTANNRWGFIAEAGLTGSSTFYGGEWVVYQLKRFTWSVGGSYYINRYGLELTAEVVQKVYGDRGVQGSMCRYFGDVSVGLYAMCTGGDVNGGFNFSVAIPGQKRLRRNKGVRVTYPEYFTRVYRAQSGIKEMTGFGYNTSPTEGSLQGYNNPIYIEQRLRR